MTRSRWALSRFVLLLTLFCTLSLQAEETEPAKEKPIATSLQQQSLLSAAKRHLEKLKSNEGLGDLVPLPRGEGNAALHYAKLEILYSEDKKEVGFHVKDGSKGLQEIFTAATIRECRLTPEFYPHMESGTSKQPDVVVFEAYLHALLRYAEEMKESRQDAAAEKAYQAALIWGWHLDKDRPNLITQLLAFSIKYKAARAYARFLRSRIRLTRARTAEAFADMIQDMRQIVTVKSGSYIGNFVNFNSLLATAEVARHDKDPLWRQEAVIRLGVLRHGAPDPVRGVLIKHDPFQQLAEKTLIEVSQKDPCPWIRKLAMWSVEHVTPERFANMARKQLFDRLRNSKEGEKLRPDEQEKPE